MEDKYLKNILLKEHWAEILKYLLEGVPSHKCCNQIKNSINFIKPKKIQKVSQSKMILLMNFNLTIITFK